MNAIHDFIERRRSRKSIGKLHSLTEAFVDSVYAFMRENGYEKMLNPIEVLVLATFVVSDVYLMFSRNRASAAETLDLL